MPREKRCQSATGAAIFIGKYRQTPFPMTLELSWAFRVRPVLGLVICIPVVMEKVGIGAGGYFGAILPRRTEPNRCRDCKGASEIFEHEKKM